MGAPTFNVSNVFDALRGWWVTQLIPWERPPSKILLRFTCFEKMPSNKADSLGVPTFNVSIAFYICMMICQAAVPLEAPRMRTLHALTAHPLRTQNMVLCGQGDTWRSISFMWPHSTFLLGFARFMRMPTNKVDFMGAPTFNVSVVFYMLWEDAE